MNGPQEPLPESYYWLRHVASRRYLDVARSGSTRLIRRRVRASLFCEHMAARLAETLGERYGGFELVPARRFVCEREREQ